MSFFSCFLSLMRVQVLAVTHSFCCLVFFPRTSLHMAFQVSLRPCHVSSTDSSGGWARELNRFVYLNLCFVFQAAYIVFVGCPVCSVSVDFQLDLQICHHQLMVQGCVCSSFDSDIQQASPLSSDGEVMDLVLSPPIW